MVMELHNTNEDIVIAQVTDIFNALEQSENPEHICTCDQCRMDTACYVLNRIEPRYIVSHRGAVRIEQESIANQQKDADIVAMIHEGIAQVNHNKRPSSVHNARYHSSANQHKPVFNIPTIIGRVFNGTNFSPMSGINIDLLRNGDIVPMLDNNWQNPFPLVEHSEGTFTFWPAPILAEAENEHKSFEFCVRINAPDFEELKHFFKIPVISEPKNIMAFSRDRTFKLPDLYLFAPGEENF
jgi:competence protein ComFB